MLVFFLCGKCHFCRILVLKDLQAIIIMQVDKKGNDEINSTHTYEPSVAYENAFMWACINSLKHLVTAVKDILIMIEDLNHLAKKFFQDRGAEYGVASFDIKERDFNTRRVNSGQNHLPKCNGFSEEIHSEPFVMEDAILKWLNIFSYRNIIRLMQTQLWFQTMNFKSL